MLKSVSAFGFLLAGFAVTAPAQAFAIEPAWVGVRAGTGGLGAEVGVRIIPTVVVRGIIQSYEYDYDVDIDDIAYTGSLNLGSFGAQVDWHPPVVPFYLTAGLFSNNNDIDLTATPIGSVTIGNTVYTGAQIGTLSGTSEFEKTAIYGGLGLKFGLGPIEAALEGGVYYQGSPQTNLTVSGPIASNPAFQADLAREVAKVTDELDSAKYWPMITLQARWKF
jgi:hypothetical protein